MQLKTSIIPLRLTPKLKEEIEEAAKIEQENVAEYVRKSVEMRNSIVLKK